MSHQSDRRHRSNFIPPRARNDDIDQVNLAARTSLGRCDRSSFELRGKLLRAVSPEQDLGTIRSVLSVGSKLRSMVQI